MLQQAFQELTKHSPKESMRGRVADAMAFQSRVLNDLQRSVMKIRMVPVEQLFRRFPRMVRDVAKQGGKEVDLIISGQDTDLDKSLLDAIAEPLTHLVRNAVGHGIENAAERARLGKPTRGTIRLDAYHQGNQVIVEIKDDGSGIDSQKVKSKALDKKIVSVDEAERLSEANIIALVFRPGFSTADEITELAGRGVGLDVVQSVLHRLKGTVEIETHPGQGTTFRLKLPLTLAIIKALLFRVEGQLYAIPLNAVAEIARAKESDFHQVDNYEVLQLRNQVLPLVRLGRPSAQPAQAAGKIFVLVITVSESKLGLIVEALEGEEPGDLAVRIEKLLLETELGLRAGRAVPDVPDELEDHVEEWPAQRIRARLSDLRHDLLHIRRTLAPTRDAIRKIIDGRIELGDDRLFPRDVELHFADAYDKLLRASEALELARDLAAGVRDYSQAKIANDQNEVMKRLTVIASVLLVPTFIVGLYGQNFHHIPELGWSFGYWWAWAWIVATTIAQVIFFRWKRWI